MGIGKAEAAIVAAAKEAFDAYAGMDSPELPTDELSALQVRLVRWQTENFGGANKLEILAGVNEEAGELSHVVLKQAQRIRGYGDPVKARVEAGDAIADCVVYLMQMATAFRLDFGTLLFGIANNVMGRDWQADRETGGVS